MKGESAKGFNKSQIVDAERYLPDYAPHGHFLPFWFYESGEVYASNGNYIGFGEIREDGKLLITQCNIK